MGKNKHKNKNRGSQENAEIRAVMDQTLAPAAAPVSAAESNVPPAAAVDASGAAEKTEKLASLDDEIAQLRAVRMKALDAELSALRDERLKGLKESETVQVDALKMQLKQQLDMFQTQLQEQRAAWEQQMKDQKAALQEQLAAQKKESEGLEEVLALRRSELDTLQKALKDQAATQNERDLRLAQSEQDLAKREILIEQAKAEAEISKSKSDRIKEIFSEKMDGVSSDIEAGVAKGIKEREKTFEAQLSSAAAENDRLRKEQEEMRVRFEALSERLGGQDAVTIEAVLAQKDALIRDLRKSVGMPPAEEVIAERDRLKAERDGIEDANRRLQDQISQMRRESSQLEQLRQENDVFRVKADAAESKAKINEDAKRIVELELERLKAIYQPSKNADARYAEIEMPYVGPERVSRRPEEKGSGLQETDWLEKIWTDCKAYGLEFNKRILKAFHTALKTSEWSPLTILAGVSGTGKSELPRLYSHFGGIVFESVPVQPNWDSQESMLGFFNSIDNRFDAQPLLRFLAQSQKEWTDEYHGLEEAVCMVLLDEMNLAHPELYFAQFLSKLEARRGTMGMNIPSLQIKAGAGVPPYELLLGRNVLWTGTMNQDETTKSLSDKVLDRSIVINFPRPLHLKRRTVLNPLNEANRGDLLYRGDWESWWVKKSLFGEEGDADRYQIGKYKKFVEDINGKLKFVGRAIGHRVWQSIEYYMSNYPDVRAAIDGNADAATIDNAMHTAFEDQIVQKIMPKLRGIDTRGTSKTECLDGIGDLLEKGVLSVDGKTNKPFNLKTDFTNAQKLGYGQFVWQSADYLNAGSLEEVDPSARGAMSESISEPVHSIGVGVASDSHAETVVAGDESTPAIGASVGAVLSDATDAVALEKLRTYAVGHQKEMWQLSMMEIKNALGCQPGELQRYKNLCNLTKPQD